MTLAHYSTIILKVLGTQGHATFNIYGRDYILLFPTQFRGAGVTKGTASRSRAVAGLSIKAMPGRFCKVCVENGFPYLLTT